MNQGKQDAVKQEMTRLHIDILGTSELKWTGMSEFNSDDHYAGPPWCFSSKESACSAGDTSLIPGSRRCPAGGPGSPLHGQGNLVGCSPQACRETEYA